MDKQELIRDSAEAQTVQVLAIMAGVVEEYGADHVYRRRGGSCHYVNTLGNGPDCLIGQVMWRLGWTVDDLRTVEGTSPSIRSGRFSELFPDAWEVLEEAQRHQDEGGPWGRCLERAKVVARTGFPDLI